MTTDGCLLLRLDTRDGALMLQQLTIDVKAIQGVLERR